MLEWLRELVMIEVRARWRNEASLTRRASFPTDGFPDIGCECSFDGCPTMISLTRAEYETVRGDGATFAIAIHHENPELDRVVVEHERYAVVEKWMREAGVMARETDPRQRLLLTREDTP